MVNRGVYLVLSSILFIFVLSCSFIHATSIDGEFKKIANYAVEYESGNINYVQLLTYTSASREKMNSLLGATGKEMGGILKEDEIKSLLGGSTEETKWVFSEGEQKEKKLTRSVPVWKKIIYDGKEMQIRLNAWPSIFSKKKFNEENKDNKEKNQEIKDLEGKLVYRLNFDIGFKQPEEQIDMQSRIDDISELAKTYSKDSSSENAEALAEASVNAEKIFWEYFKQSGEKCENLMNSIFGGENKKRTQSILVQEINFCEGDNFEVIARLEMCDDCEWNWVNVNFNVEGRGPGFKIKDEKKEIKSPENYKNMDIKELENEITGIRDELKQMCESKNFGGIISKGNEIWPLSDALNQKSNDVWKELDKTYQDKVNAMSPEERYKFDQSYGWIKLEQEKRQKVKELQNQKYEERKQFYINLFSGYDKTESYYTQIEYEKRLVEEFTETGREICSNNLDDNNDGNIDCAEQQCGGKICGKGSVNDGNDTREINYYCIENECKAREEQINIVIENNFTCAELPAVECSIGSKAYFSKYNDETNCPIEVKCLEETTICEKTEDCSQPACGKAECMENKCQVTELTECKETECIDGEQKICDSTSEVVELCVDGFWKKTGECLEEPEIKEEIVMGNECLSASDCGEGVCNNGKCELLPEVIVAEDNFKEEQEQIREKQEENSNEESSSNEGSEISGSDSESGITGNIIKAWERFTGFVISGFEVAEGETVDTSSSENNRDSEDSSEKDSGRGETEYSRQEGTEVIAGDNNQEQNNNEDERRKDDDRRRQEDDRERRETENKNRCSKDCERPCVEQCIRDECGEKLSCVVEDMQKKCEEKCAPEDSCIAKCMKGGDWWDEEFGNEQKNKQEKGVFQAGGSCRTSQGKTEGNIWFGGWGAPFEKIQYLKNKYYSGGQAEWCKYDYENLKKQREEFEKGFNQGYAVWFFEKYLANSAEDWESAVSGIYELYWKDVDNSRELAYRMDCLGINEAPTSNLINFKYEGEYGKIEFWEEVKTVKLEGLEQEKQVISPYMKVWIFPTKEFIFYEMKKSMKNHEFPGSDSDKTNRKNEEGLKLEEKEYIKQNEKFMDKIRKLAEKYEGSFDVKVQLVDYEKNEVVFNVYVQVNENDILNIKPMLPEEVPNEDAIVELDFEKIYNLIYSQEKEMQGDRIESPPWDRKMSPVQTFKDMKNGVKMYFKVRDIINSAKITPSESEDDVKSVIKSFMSMMMNAGDKAGQKEEGDEKKGVDKAEGKGKSGFGDAEEKSITGNVIFGR
jgi:hypothetical protein